MEAGASAGTRDDSGMTALTLMVTKMPSVVSKTNLSMLEKNGLKCVPILKLNAVSQLGDNLPSFHQFEFVFHGYSVSLSEKHNHQRLTMALNRLSPNREQLGNRAVCAFIDERLFFSILGTSST